MMRWFAGILGIFSWLAGFSNLYDSPTMWHQHPNRAEHVLDTTGNSEKQADVFYIHPTIRDNGHGTNSSRFHPAQTSRIQEALWNQAHAFSKTCRVYAPSYRHVFLSTLMRKDTALKSKALDTAYADIRAAFQAYLKHWNMERPIFIASHSQGSYLALRLLEEFFDNDQNSKLVTAYIIGYTVPEDLFERVYHQIEYCTDSLQTGCIVSWRTYGKHAKTSPLDQKMYMNKYPSGHELSLGKNIHCTNPMTWSGSGYEGSLSSTIVYPAPLPKTRRRNHYVKSEVSEGRLFVYFDDMNSFNAPGHDLHVYDYNIFMDLIRQNVAVRLRAYLHAESGKH